MAPVQVGNPLFLASAASITTFDDNGSKTSLFNVGPSTTLAINKQPVNATDAANKEYVDIQITTLTNLDSSKISQLSTLITSYSGSDFASYTSLSSELSTETSARISGDTSLTSALSSESSSRSSADTSLSSALSTETSSRILADNLLSTDLSSETSSRSSADASLSSALSSETSSRSSADASLSSALSSETSSRSSADASLSSALSSETSSRSSADASLSSALSSETSSRSSADASLSSALSSETSRAESAEALITKQLLRNEIVALNSLTTGNQSKPQYVDSSGIDTNLLVDGWYFSNTTPNTKIQWGSTFVDNTGHYSLNANTGIDQICYTAFISKVTAASDLPYLVAYTSKTNNPYSDNNFYAQRIEFLPSNVGTIYPGLYTFVANLSSNVPPPATFNSTIINLTFSATMSDDKINSSTPIPSNFSDWSISNPVYYVTVQTSTNCPVNNVSLTLSDLNIVTNNSNQYIPSGTYNYKFTNSVVANAFLYEAVNDLYLEFYQTSIKNTIFPGQTTYIGY